MIGWFSFTIYIFLIYHCISTKIFSFAIKIKNSEIMKKALLIVLVTSLFFACGKEKEKKEKQEERTQKTEEKKQEDKQADIKASTLSSVGQTIPEFTFTTTNGKQYSTKDLKGKTVLINLFATWCPSCQEELPALQKLWEQYKEKDFILVSIGREHSMEEMKKFKSEKKYSFYFAPDQERTIYNHFAKKYIPRNILINEKGEIVFQCVGYKKEDFKKLTNMIEKEIKTE